MIKMLLVPPFKELQGTFQRYVERMDTRDMEIDIRHLYGSRTQLEDISDYKIVAARGITGRSIRQRYPDVAFVEIAITSDDIINALMEAVRRCGRGRIALVLSGSIHISTDSIREMSGLDLETFRVQDEDDVEAVIPELYQREVSCVVGGLTICRRCWELGLPSVAIRTGDETVERTIQVAVETARGIERERMKNHLLRTLLDYQHDGILACDNQGIVTEANVQAGYFLTHGTSLAADLVGQSIDELLPDSGWRDVAAKGVAKDEMREFAGGMMTVVRCMPMLVDGQEAGMLFLVRNAEMIRDTDSQIQKQVRQNGFTAQYTFGDILAQNEEMKQRIVSAYKYAQVDANVLLLGETGTGKEMFAQSIHNAGARRHYPFVAVNCAALPEQLLESEMFGYSEGAFSGAKKGGKIGLFELAHKGTIFLDEIGEMPMNLQAKLLRVLQEKEIRRIGDNKVISIDVRVISATNISIREKIAQGKFRSDLYYRINLLELRLPPLRERPEDVELIFRRLLERYCREAQRPVPMVTGEAIAMMQSQPWYGNIRELRNFSERLAILNDGGVIDRKQLELAGLLDYSQTAGESGEPPAAGHRERLRKEDIAKELGISRTTLWRRSKQEAKRRNEQLKRNETE